MTCEGCKREVPSLEAWPVYQGTVRVCPECAGHLRAGWETIRRHTPDAERHLLPRLPEAPAGNLFTERS